jgi:type II secretory pathway component PulJ
MEEQAMNPSLDQQLTDRVRKMPPGIFQELIEHCMVERDRWRNENHLLRSELYRIRDLVGTVDAEIITRLLEGELPCPKKSPTQT